MPLEILVSRDWLRSRISADPDVETDAGAAFSEFEELGMFVAPDLVDAPQKDSVKELSIAFGTLVRQLRRRDQLTVVELAKKADVEEEELRRIEHDASYKPRPRTVYQLANTFKVATERLMKLSGAKASNDERFKEEALKFAARSDDLSRLTDEERRLLNDFVAFLSKQEGDDR